MLRIKKILVPTDFSACSEEAVRYASELALCVKAKLYVLHVAEHSSDGGDPDSTPVANPAVHAETAAESRKSNAATDSCQRRQLRPGGLSPASSHPEGRHTGS